MMAPTHGHGLTPHHHDVLIPFSANLGGLHTNRHSSKIRQLSGQGPGVCHFHTQRAVLDGVRLADPTRNV